MNHSADLKNVVVTISKVHLYKKKVLIDVLCEDIIVLFDESTNTQNEMIIPKHSKKWEKIEFILYKELLNFIYKYKTNLIMQDVQDDELKNIIIQNLNKDLYLKYFKIRKYMNNTTEILYVKPPPNDPNRYNILKFIYCLNGNNCEIMIENNTILLECGNLLLFPNDILYKIKIPISEKQYIIYGEVAYIENNK